VLADDLVELDLTHTGVILIIIFLVHYAILKFRYHDASEVRLRKKIEEQSMLDGLTNLPNRRSFDRALQQEWQHCLRADSPLALLLCDIDFFKNYNDSLGHLAGDECLKKVARSLRKAAQRPTDFVGRYGGEEFVFVLPNTDLEGASKVAKSVHQHLLASKIQHGASEVSEHITMSIGIAACIPSQDDSAMALLESSDKRLYAAKEHGRNRSVADEALEAMLDEAVADLC
ncbi:MAG: diguanylate cyclase, partial [Mariprofundaceae bacterium]|nr:diguanylate cyclase [Mariprofundaceae bacterium]